MSILPLPGSSITAFLSCDRSESRGANQPGTGIISLSSFKWISLRDLSHQGKLLTGGSSNIVAAAMGVQYFLFLCLGLSPSVMPQAAVQRGLLLVHTSLRFTLVSS